MLFRHQYNAFQALIRPGAHRSSKEVSTRMRFGRRGSNSTYLKELRRPSAQKFYFSQLIGHRDADSSLQQASPARSVNV
jgi:hypothetical protein